VSRVVLLRVSACGKPLGRPQNIVFVFAQHVTNSYDGKAISNNLARFVGLHWGWSPRRGIKLQQFISLFPGERHGLLD